MGTHHFPHNYLSAEEAAATQHDYVANLKQLKSTLKESFNAQFGEDALLNYYQGKIKITMHDEDDRVMRFSESGKARLQSRTFNPHFHHEKSADALGVNFGPLHIPILQPYFMAVALHKKTANPLYKALADDLLEDFEISAQQNLGPNTTKLDPDAAQKIRKAVAFVTDVMIEHTHPILSK